MFPNVSFFAYIALCYVIAAYVPSPIAVWGLSMGTEPTTKPMTYLGLPHCPSIAPHSHILIRLSNFLSEGVKAKHSQRQFLILLNNENSLLSMPTHVYDIISCLMFLLESPQTLNK